MKYLAFSCFLTFLTATVTAGEPQPAATKESSAAKPACELCKIDSHSLVAISETPWLEPSARKKAWKRSFVLTNQDEQSLAVNEIFDKPVAMTFLYTRCENPNKCPLAASTLAKLQDEVAKAGLSEDVRLVVVTYDPEFDTPAVLKKYAEERNIRCGPNVMMLRPDPTNKAAFFEAMKVTVNYDDKRVNIHGLQMLLIDRKGRFVRSHHTLIWDNTKVLADLKRLAQEPN